MLALLRAGRPAPGRAPPRAIDYSCGLNLFKARLLETARNRAAFFEQARAVTLTPPAALSPGQHDRLQAGRGHRERIAKVKEVYDEMMRIAEAIHDRGGGR